MMQINTDFHSHILPGMDDGSRSVEESLDMLRMEADQGITRVVATPHFYPHRDHPDRFLRRREKAEMLLREAMAGKKNLPELYVGAEVYYFSGISDSELISELTIDQKGCILLELPSVPWTETMYREIEGLYSKRGLVPIIAHVDRYLTGWHGLGIPKRLAELPVLVQANADFFLERATARKAMRMLKEDSIHLLGSDCHNCGDRKPNLGNALDRIRQQLGDHALERIASYERMALKAR